ncbi:TIGR03915 family putative DNA repair protein [Moraxella haemolytica]|uniref:TIGR03915 family putative DNA repair protein n=1 Tax=Moraxella haemolytica TaxID=2904119 RepID=UPI0025437DF2|nr:TIGR03915 family putative DNA repair protein [Moraxella sp. ZY171148]WII94552.1 TIGR03915 family putative DNA repair protein [Moraxella sp. ZY171148]
MVDLFGDDGVALVFDGSFEGWLSVVFYAYEHRLIGRHITVVAKHDEIPHLFLTTLQVPTDEKKALRVLDKIRQILDLRQVIWAFLSEDATIYTHLLSVVVHQLDHPNKNVMQNYAHPDVLAVHQCIKKVGRERHRMQAFVRFECTDNDVYFAKVNPDFNVLPLIGDFFAKRFADQSWLIFDVVRGYGIFYDHTNPKAGVREVVDIDQGLLDDSSTIHGEKEPIYQRLWQAYFRHVTIKERINTKHHIAQMPRRYWQYLTEKKGF